MEGILGIIFSLLGSFVSELIGPASSVTLGFKGIRALSNMRRRLSTDDFYDGEWIQTWFVTSEDFSRDNTSELRIHRFMKRISAEFDVKSTRGTIHKIRVVADIQGNVLTGRWSDPEENGYYGSFQLLISPFKDGMEGKWIGFSRKNIVRADKMVWALKSQNLKR
jgi:hypothetical protein